MTDRVFIDTNILVYSFLDNEQEKHNKAVKFLAELRGKKVFISTQVLSELYSALNKNNLTHNQIETCIYQLRETFNISVIFFETIEKCFEIKRKYGFSYWDSLIISAAIDCNCSLIFSEDLQDNQLIDNKIRIVNPLNEEK